MLSTCCRSATTSAPAQWLNNFTHRSTATRRTSTIQGTLYTLTLNTLVAADFLLTHVAKPGRGNGSLRFVYGAVGYLAMAKLLLVIFTLPARGRMAHQRSLLGRKRSASSWLHTSGTPAWPAV